MNELKKLAQEFKENCADPDWVYCNADRLLELSQTHVLVHIQKINELDRIVGGALSDFRVPILNDYLDRHIPAEGGEQ